jgi:hypothetical protein
MKPCPGCPTPGRCVKAGKCMKKAGAKSAPAKKYLGV